MMVYLTNLGAYNEGELRGKWVDPACCDWEEELKAIGIGESRGEGMGEYEEYFITDYEDAPDGLGENEPLDRLSEIAEYCDGSDGDVFMALCEQESIDEAMERIENGNYSIYWLGNSMMDDDEKLGYALVEEGLIDIPENLRNYFDYEAYGRDFRYDTVGSFCDIGGNSAYLELY